MRWSTDYSYNLCKLLQIEASETKYSLIKCRDINNYGFFIFNGILYCKTNDILYEYISSENCLRELSLEDIHYNEDVLRVNKIDLIPAPFYDVIIISYYTEVVKPVPRLDHYKTHIESSIRTMEDVLEKFCEC